MKVLSVFLFALLLLSCQQHEVLPQQTTAQKGLSLDDQRILILVDGKVVSSEALQAVDPNTIESIEVIKDPNTIKKYTSALYQGVVKINLKK